jgi:uncharacterized repeat protein (TIGR01451 family)
VFGPTRYLGVLVVGVLVAGLLSGVAASRTTIVAGGTAKKRCHYVVKKVRSKKKRVRVCRVASADVRLAFAIQPAPPITPGGHVTFSVHITNRGPDAATQTYLDVLFPPGYKNISASQRGTACSTSGGGDQGTSLQCPKVALRKAGVLNVTVRVDLGFAIPVIPNVSDVVFNANHGVRDPNDLNDSLSWEPDLANCADAYLPDLCIPPPPPDLSCADIAPFTSIRVDGTAPYPDPQGFDPDRNGTGCES